MTARCKLLTALVSLALVVGLATAAAGLAAAPGRSQITRTLTAAPGRSQITRALTDARARLATASPLGTLTGPRTLRVTGTGFAPDSPIVVAQCSVRALKAAATAVSTALDYCDEHFVGVGATDAAGAFAVRGRAIPTIQTAAGTVNCARTSCLLGALNLGALHGAPLQVAILPLAFTRSAATVRPPRPVRRVLAQTYPVPPVTPARPARLRVTAYPAGQIGAGRIGRVVTVPARKLPRSPVTGEGLLALTMSAPQTSWSSPIDTSVVVRARVDRGPWQQIVLFAGASPFTYEGFTGRLRTGRHAVSVQVQRSLSQFAGTPTALIARASLRVVSPHTAAGLALAHAPVLYDRRVGAFENTPLLSYAVDHRLSGGAHRLSYTYVFSREDAGTGFVPWLEWGTWGRMTDIETAISFTVHRDGRVSDATYLACLRCGRHFADNRTALDETEAPFRGRWSGGHPILRVSTGNNDFSDVGTTPLRVQQAPAAPPPPGDTREGAMDSNPWTYAVMGAELHRNRADYSTSAASAAPGDPRQYLIVQLDTTARAATAVGVDIRLAGSPAVYSNDLGTGYPLYDGGLGRTVVKVPLAAAGRPITMLRLRLVSGSAATPSLAVHRVTVLQYVHDRVVARHVPAPRVVVVAAAPAAPAGTPAIAATVS